MNTPTPDIPRSYRLILLSLTLALVGVGTAITALRLSSDIAEQVSLLPPLEVAAGIFWVVVFAAIAWRLWLRKPGAARALGWALMAWIGYSVLRLSVFARADYDRQRLPFLWVAGLIGCVLIGIFLLRPGRTGAAHRETNEHEQRED